MSLSDWEAEAGDLDWREYDAEGTNAATLAELEDGTCPYYARWEGLKQLPWYDADGTCYQGCYDEPACVTCVPNGGWPSVHAALKAGEGL